MNVESITPWHTKEGELVFSYHPLRDIVFVWPDPPPKTLGKAELIHIPEQQRKKYHNGVGTILTIGSGYVNDKGKFHSIPSKLKPGVKVVFDITVPWGVYIEGQDKKKYYVVICGLEDIRGTVEG